MGDFTADDLAEAFVLLGVEINPVKHLSYATQRLKTKNLLHPALENCPFVENLSGSVTDAFYVFSPYLVRDRFGGFT